MVTRCAKDRYIDNCVVFDHTEYRLIVWLRLEPKTLSVEVVQHNHTPKGNKNLDGQQPDSLFMKASNPNCKKTVTRAVLGSFYLFLVFLTELVQPRQLALTVAYRYYRACEHFLGYYVRTRAFAHVINEHAASFPAAVLVVISQPFYLTFTCTSLLGTQMWGTRGKKRRRRLPCSTCGC